MRDKSTQGGQSLGLVWADPVVQADTVNLPPSFGESGQYTLGRFPGLWVRSLSLQPPTFLLPSHPSTKLRAVALACRKDYPITVAGPHRNHTGFPIIS